MHKEMTVLCILIILLMSISSFNVLLLKEDRISEMSKSADEIKKVEKEKR